MKRRRKISKLRAEKEKCLKGDDSDEIKKLKNDFSYVLTLKISPNEDCPISMKNYASMKLICQ